MEARAQCAALRDQYTKNEKKGKKDHRFHLLESVVFGKAPLSVLVATEDEVEEDDIFFPDPDDKYMADLIRFAGGTWTVRHNEHLRLRHRGIS